jgi:lipopolysaccharide transport system ATP-binding protein
MAVISVEHLYKEYRLGVVNHGTLVQDMQSAWARFRGKEDPNSMVVPGGANLPRTDERGHFLALQDISFTVNQGDALAIIGRNGAGKSTLLKIMSRITAPTSGTIRLKGRLASLLEVGTGFHPELTGRENVFMNGAILGMKKREIASKLDEIIAFSGIEQFIDTPVKRYSSGMYVRLAFAVAAHLESEIMIIDEVLAVGDAEFQRKCLGKMDDVTTREGRTILFVSHNITAVKKLCNTGIQLTGGRITAMGHIDDVVASYTSFDEPLRFEFDMPEEDFEGKHEGIIHRLRVEDVNGTPCNDIPIGKPWQVRMYVRLFKPLTDCVVALGMVDSADYAIHTSWTEPQDLAAGEYQMVFRNDDIHFTNGKYYLCSGLSSGSRSVFYKGRYGYLNITDALHEKESTIVKAKGTGIVLNQLKTSVVRG